MSRIGSRYAFFLGAWLLIGTFVLCLDIQVALETKRSGSYSVVIFSVIGFPASLAPISFLTLLTKSGVSWMVNEIGFSVEQIVAITSFEWLLFFGCATLQWVFIFWQFRKYKAKLKNSQHD